MSLFKENIKKKIETIDELELDLMKFDFWHIPILWGVHFFLSGKVFLIYWWGTLRTPLFEAHSFHAACRSLISSWYPFLISQLGYGHWFPRRYQWVREKALIIGRLVEAEWSTWNSFSYKHIAAHVICGHTRTEYFYFHAELIRK